MSPISPEQTEKTSKNDQAPSRPTSFKSVGLPAEHGSWSLVSEPILLGLLIVPSWAGTALAVAAFSLFLFNRPFKIYWGDRRRGRRYERSAMAGRYASISAIVAIVNAAVAFGLAGLRPFMPLVMAAPLLATFMIFDQRPGRHWQAELSAPTAFGAIVSAIVLAGGLGWLPALALWAFVVARAIPAVLFIRARLRLDKGKPVQIRWALFAHVMATIAVGALVWAGWLPRTAMLAALILLARAIWGLSTYRRRSSVKALGFLETGFGVMAILLVALGYWLN